ncbi:Type II secretory pathway, ATPase PulE/Tfp pilus assembly pathway, ATPase PilB [Olavius sp. associated proteobacterium Delta 1]|nr:Type II secretory pathway, ATPase PulE/Tfp pilus assembly pathway, ATPase PilB [Olavius sp. associated proteobacterium Delta 1]
MRTDIESRVNEAEVCRSMGLYGDSLSIYENILTIVPPQDSQTQDKIQKRINLLKKEMSEDEKTKPKKVSAEDISMFKKTFSTEGDVSEILDSASAFQEMGLHAEAIAEYVGLFKEDYPKEKIVPQVTESLLKMHSPGKAVEEFDKIIAQEKLKKQDIARIKFLLGQELERREYRDQAHDLYQLAAELDPEDPEIKKRYKSIAATFTSGSKYDFLLREDIVTTDKLQQAFALSKKMKKSVEFVLLEHFQINKEALGKSFSLFYGCPFKAYDPEFPVPTELLRNLKKSFLLNEMWIPLSWGKEGVDVLVDDPRDLNKTDNIKTLMKTGKLTISVAIREDIQKFIKLFFDPNKQAANTQAGADVLDDFDLIPDVEFEEEEEDIEIDEADETSSRVVKLVDQAIIAAYRKNASDIHIEPSPITKATTIRFRLDGVCQEYLKVPNSMVRGIISRIKIMSNLDIAERRLPQDGKIKFRRKGVPTFELRVATLPTAGGFEDVVMRILASAGAMAIDEMGLTERNLEVMTKIIYKPYGLILAVGPTGSGKTTSLHAILGHINTPGVKIWTAEDPVEITQAGLRQTEVRPKIGLDFARMMRAFLRADPDIIMIGEMRDEETASIGIEASLTGHLVFSTLHTNSAPETITRLLDMGLNPLNFSDAFLGVLAQRLTRRLCNNCREEYPVTEDDFEMIVNDFGKEHFATTGIEYSSEMTLAHHVGCDNCSGTGYRGRMGIHELMEGTPEVKLMIKKQANTEQIFERAMQDGMLTLKQDGILKVMKGDSDMEEVRRVCIN